MIPTPTPTPEFHGSVVVRPVSGRVLIKKPGTNDFVPLDSLQSIPLGSTIDVRLGRIKLTSEPGKGKPAETAIFYGGIFTLSQPGGVIELKLTEALAACPKAKKSSASASATKPKVRRLWGSGKGNFRTTGKYSSATIRGTTWLVEDSCSGTLTRVKDGVVSVHDSVRKKNVLVRGGKSYTAKPKR